MKRFIKDERTGLTYELVGDYYLPAGEDDLPPLGIWGRHRLTYLKAHRRDLYADLLLSGKLEEHLTAIDVDAAEMTDRLTRQLTKADGVTEALKAADPMAWVGLMNSIQAQVREIVNNELIYNQSKYGEKDPLRNGCSGSWLFRSNRGSVPYCSSRT